MICIHKSEDLTRAILFSCKIQRLVIWIQSGKVDGLESFEFLSNYSNRTQTVSKNQSGANQQNEAQHIVGGGMYTGKKCRVGN